MKILKTIEESKEVSIVDLMHDQLHGMEKARPVKNIHASELTKETPEFCPREYALLDITGKTRRDQFVPTSLRYTFDMGNDIQERLNNSYLLSYMVGDWKCQSCGNTKKLTKVPEYHCGKYGVFCNWKYEEHRGLSLKSGASCGIDGLLDLPGHSKLVLIEIKTINTDDFKKLAAPLSEHRLRTNFYLRIIAESYPELAKRVTTDYGYVVYCQKGYGVKAATVKGDSSFSPFKEFKVKRNDEATETYYQKSRAVKLFREGETGIPGGVCPNSFCSRAHSCPVLKECWSGNYVAQSTWEEGGSKKHSSLQLISKG